MRSAFLMMTVFLTLGVGIAAAQSAEESAVTSRLDEVYAALNRGDVEGYLLNYHEDVVYAINNNVFIGRADVATFESPSFTNGMQIEYTHHATRLLSPTTAITHGSQVMTSATPPLEGHVVNTWVKVGNDWVIAALQVAWAPPQ
ncbi:MAG: nuclear transport factor 2 family protein [Acidobacteriota bacterium]|nr:nuclear transport factor 2 family protein [Acidobacteriota bacterium]